MGAAHAADHSGYASHQPTYLRQVSRSGHQKTSAWLSVESTRRPASSCFKPRWAPHYTGGCSSQSGLTSWPCTTHNGPPCDPYMLCRFISFSLACLAAVFVIVLHLLLVQNWHVGTLLLSAASLLGCVWSGIAAAGILVRNKHPRACGPRYAYQQPPA